MAAESKVSFTNAARQRLVGTYTDARSDNVVILCHGYASSKDGFHFPAMAREFAKKKLSCLRFDFSGNGESEGAFEFGNYVQEVGDVRAAVQYVKQSLRKTPVAIVGHSKGGNVVLLYAAQYDDVPLVVNIAGRFDMAAGIQERFGVEVLSKVDKMGQVQMTAKTDRGDTVKWMLTKQSIAERLKIDMEAAGRKISLAEVLTIHGTADKVIPLRDAEQFSKCIRQHMLCAIDGADHNFTNASHADLMTKKAIDFIVQGL